MGLSTVMGILVVTQASLAFPPVSGVKQSPVRACCPNPASIAIGGIITGEHMAPFLVRALGLPHTDVDYSIDDDKSIRLLQVAGQFSQELVGGHANGGNQSQFVGSAVDGAP